MRPRPLRARSPPHRASHLRQSLRSHPRQGPPTGEVWVHQPKLDGFRCIVVKNGGGLRVYSRRGVEFRLPGMAAALTNLGAETAVIDGELICVGADGRADFYGLMRQMRSSKLDESARAQTAALQQPIPAAPIQPC